jgi:hypothetical protein
MNSSQEGTGEANPKLGVKLRSGPTKLRKTCLIPCFFFVLCTVFILTSEFVPSLGKLGPSSLGSLGYFTYNSKIFTGYWYPEIAALKRIVHSQPGFFSSALEM